MKEKSGLGRFHGEFAPLWCHILRLLIGFVVRSEAAWGWFIQHHPADG